MDTEIIKKLMEKEYYYNYLKENSEWVKYLKRDKNKYTEFVKFIKEKYKLRAKDKLNNAVENLGVLSEVLSTLK